VGGGGAVSAVQLARLGGSCVLFTALGHDEPGRLARAALERRGVRVEAAGDRDGTREALTFLDGRGSRTITVLGPETLPPHGRDPLAWDELDRLDAALLISGDAATAHHARRARVLVATGRALGALAEAGVRPDALVGSGEDARERYVPGDLPGLPGLVVETAGAAGGRWWDGAGASGRYAAATPPRPPVDDYGAGDCFAAGLTFALGRGGSPDAALELAARCGAACLGGRAPLGGMLGGAPETGAP
jgi:ribokinase